MILPKGELSESDVDEDVEMKDESRYSSILYDIHGSMGVSED